MEPSQNRNLLLLDSALRVETILYVFILFLFLFLFPQYQNNSTYDSTTHTYTLSNKGSTGVLQIVIGSSNSIT